jgi:predicted DNA-binding transcriptional regulator AlpA
MIAMTERLLTVEQVAKRTGYTLSTIAHYSILKEFPPPRMYGPRGRKFYAAEDIDFWLEGHKTK